MSVLNQPHYFDINISTRPFNFSVTNLSHSGFNITGRQGQELRPPSYYDGQDRHWLMSRVSLIKTTDTISCTVQGRQWLINSFPC